MERKIYEDLLKWKKDSNKKPLLLYGSRQIGKTYTTTSFGEKEYKTVAYINTENNKELLEILKKENTVDRIISKLSLLTGESILKEDTLIILDNVTEGDIVKAIKKFGKKVFLKLYVKTMSKWRDKMNYLKELGFYDIDE